MSHYLITGAAGGIGSAIASRLTGHQLTLVGRNPTSLADLAAQHSGATTLATDLTTEAGAQALGDLLATLPPLAGAVHAVGSLILKPAHRLSFSEWRAALATNLDSAFLVLQLVAKAQVAQPHPCSLVLISSVAAGLGLANHEAIAAAKAGIEGLVRAAAASYAGTGLRVNAIAPALTETPLTTGMTTNEQIRKAVTAMHPLGRLGTANDQAAAVCFLLGEESSWITGQVLGVDGGLRTVRGK
jgi:NAD(P)-dependent dehydrogenase (short-subunit alcohol dehydrogenase family)